MKHGILKSAIICGLIFCLCFVITSAGEVANNGILYYLQYSETSDKGLYWMDTQGDNQQLIVDYEMLGIEDDWQIARFDVFDNFIVANAYRIEEASANSYRMWLIDVGETMQIHTITDLSTYFPAFSPNGSLIAYSHSPSTSNPLDENFMVYDLSTNIHHFILSKNDISDEFEQIDEVIHSIDIVGLSDDTRLVSAMILNSDRIMDAALVMVQLDDEFHPHFEYISNDIIYMEAASPTEIVYDVYWYDDVWRFFKYDVSSQQESILFDTSNEPIFAGNVHHQPHISGYDIQDSLITIGIEDDIYIVDTTSSELFAITRTEDERERMPRWFKLPENFVNHRKTMNNEY